MPGSEYAAAGGGALKLKGSGGVDKKKKKKLKPSGTEEKKDGATEPSKSKSLQDALAAEDDVKDLEGRDSADEPDLSEDLKKDLIQVRGKTETERRHEERRRKRLDERLKREGIKTHKERVEELNRYLSNLSEHHDMPRIGPG
ncbi:hypothetical protein LTS18_003319 [Coniosporium uncinatum]|uniref:Uncharacterized protein n=1 Tax=Coniosporium uncinatum TaxID=93489 RepID=A0ACC3DTN2_9PEZI|nr:hypothetical protein LTS18_003319 [Coniosporium uncinatum]